MTVQSPSDLEGIKRVGRLVARALRVMRRATRPGITTAQLDEIGATFLRRHGARSAPQLTYGFPGFSCISVNDEIVHGVPGPRVLAPRDVVKLDVTAELDGYIADAAVTVILAPVPAQARRLRRCARAAFGEAMRVARPGSAVREIGRAVEMEVQRHGFSVLPSLCGHGVGRALHEAPSVPNYYSALTRGTLTEGLVLAVEPIVAAEPALVVEEADGWTLRTHNHALAVHYEHTVVITKGEPLVVTM